jgi:ABC-2 type transport system ATP-binding protein
MLQIQQVVRRFGERVALNGVSFDIGDTEVVGFVGRNGAGKTTTMRVIMGLLDADEGRVLWNGSPISDTDRRLIGYMPEERGLYPKMRCNDQLAYFAQLAGVPRHDAKQHASDLLESFGLAERAGETVDKLSLGNQQRIQLAAALVGRPQLLVLDEPFSGLDPVGVDALSALLKQRTAAGVGMLFSSHQLELLEQLADRVVIIDNGKILADEQIDPTNRGALGVRYRALIAEAEAGAEAQVNV